MPNKRPKSALPLSKPKKIVSKNRPRSRSHFGKKKVISVLLIRACRKYKIKLTHKVGGKRVYKKISVLKKQLRKKQLRNKKTTKRNHHYRVSRFGNEDHVPIPDDNAPGVPSKADRAKLEEITDNLISSLENWKLQKFKADDPNLKDGDPAFKIWVFKDSKELLKKGWNLCFSNNCQE
jgi:hypothetical protein